MQSSPRAGLRFRVSLLILVAVLPAMLLNTASTIQQRRVATQDTRHSAMQLARAIAAEQDQAARGVGELLTSLAMVPAVRAMDADACPDLLAAFLERFPHYTSLSVVTPDGALACRGSRIGQPTHVHGLAAESAFDRALATGEFSVGAYGVGAVTGRAVVPFAWPLTDPDGRVAGVITATLDLMAPERHASSADFPAGGTLMVLDGSGTVLVRYPDPQRWSGIAWPEGSPVRDVLARAEHGTAEAEGLDGTQRLYAVSRLPAPGSAPAYVMVGIPRAQAFAAANRRLLWNLLALMLFGVLAVGAGWGVGTRILVAPVRSLVGATRRLAGGDLATRADTSPGGGELAELGLAFNEMAESLEGQTAETAASVGALQRSEQRYRLLVEASAAIVWSMSPSGTFDDPQPGWSEFTGQSPEASAGRGWLNAVHPDDRERVGSAWSAAARAGEAYRLEQRLRRYDGEYRHMLVRAVPIRGEAGAVREWIGVHTDVTARRRAEQDRAALLAREQEARAEAEQANRAKSDFLAVVSHELRTPLTSIISFAELMDYEVDGSLSERHREYLERIGASAWHLKEIVDQILEFTRLEAGPVPVALETVDLVGVARAAAESVEPLCGTRCLALRTAFPAAAVLVFTDATRVRQILLNLLSNSIKFTDHGEVRVELVTGDGQARLRVHDTGPGIEPQHLTRIWDTFWQAENPLTRRAGGTGLGLAIVRRLTSLLGGTIRAESAPGQGCTFELSLPLAEQGAARAGGAAQHAGPVPATVAGGGRQPGWQPRSSSEGEEQRDHQ